MQEYNHFHFPELASLKFRRPLLRFFNIYVVTTTLNYALKL